MFCIRGKIFEDGINVRDDSERTALINKGQKYLLKSCDLNYGDGCAFYAIANLFNSLDDVMIDNKHRDFKTAMLYIKKSCELDSSMGCEELGDSYWKGDGVKKDEKLSFLYRKKSCDLAQIPKNTLLSETGLLGGKSCMKVGLMYYNGEGVAKNK